MLSTISAVRNIDPVYLKVAKNFGIKQPAVLYKIVFPAVFPQIANSLHVALGSAWIFLVSGEMVGTQSGLGYMIIDARNNLRMDYLLAAMVMIGLIGFILDALIGKFEKTVMKAWERRDNMYIEIQDATKIYEKPGGFRSSKKVLQRLTIFRFK